MLPGERRGNLRAVPGRALFQVLFLIAIAAVAGMLLLKTLDPAGMSAQERDAQRASDVAALARALADDRAARGALPPEIDTRPGSSQMIGEAISGCNAGCGPAGAIEAACLSLREALSEAGLAVPVDPRGTDGTVAYDAARTGYYVNLEADGRLIVGACHPERAAAIVTEVRVDSASGTGTMPPSS